MQCASCGRELPSAFPGGTAVCACGARTEVPGADLSSRPSGGPYRAPQAALAEATERAITCPFCGKPCAALARMCPHCDVWLGSRVRCRRCYSLQAPGAFACGRCGDALALEPLFDATDAPCPRCAHPLEMCTGTEARMHECPRCGGLFVPRASLSEILARAAQGAALPMPAAAARRADEPAVVRYLPCPQCHGAMNRVTFGRTSGIVVDVCRDHGTWFDAGELTRAVAFAVAAPAEDGEPDRTAVWARMLEGLG